MTRRLTPRDQIVYAIGFATVAAVLCAMGFTSHDGDSSLYAGISAHLSVEPVRQWIAPRWFALWPDTLYDQLFLEHPGGLFWLPAAMGRFLGLPGGPSAYVVGVAAGLGSLLWLSALVERVAGAAASRATLILLPFMPVSFVFRVRANHEYPMFFCLVAALVGLDRVRRAWGWTALVAAAFTGALLVKGIFSVLVVGAAGLWLLVNPARDRQAPLRPWIAVAVGLVTMLVAALAYDRAYANVTGHPFWSAYWERQIGPMSFASPAEHATVVIEHVWFYVTHVLWDSAPWGLVLAWVAWLRLRGAGDHPLTDAERRGLTFVLLFTVAAALALSVPSRFAERYTFSAVFLMGAAGVAAAWLQWPGVRRAIERADAAIPALPAVVWTALVLGRVILIGATT